MGHPLRKKARFFFAAFHPLLKAAKKKKGMQSHYYWGRSPDGSRARAGTATGVTGGFSSSYRAGPARSLPDGRAQGGGAP